MIFNTFISYRQKIKKTTSCTFHFYSTKVLFDGRVQAIILPQKPTLQTTTASPGKSSKDTPLADHNFVTMRRSEDKFPLSPCYRPGNCRFDFYLVIAMGVFFWGGPVGTRKYMGFSRIHYPLMICIWRYFCLEKGDLIEKGSCMKYLFQRLPKPYFQ